MKGKRALPKLRPLLGVCEASLAEASGCHAQLSWRPRQAVLWGSRGYSRRYTIPNPAYLINMDIHRATGSDPKSDVRRGKALPLAGSHPSDAARRMRAHLSRASQPQSPRNGYRERNGRERHPTDPACASGPGTGIPPRRRLFRVAAIHAAELGKASLPCPDVDQFAAGARCRRQPDNAATGCVRLRRSCMYGLD
jgi:hypothetical protein